MRHNKKNIAIFIAVAMSMSACKNSDFLDVSSQETVEAVDRNVTYTPEQFVNGIYGMFTEWDYAFSFLGITEMLSDNADKGSSPTDTGTDKDILDNLTYTSTAGSFQAMWARW